MATIIKEIEVDVSQLNRFAAIVANFLPDPKRVLHFALI